MVASDKKKRFLRRVAPTKPSVPEKAGGDNDTEWGLLSSVVRHKAPLTSFRRVLNAGVSEDDFADDKARQVFIEIRDSVLSSGVVPGDRELTRRLKFKAPFRDGFDFLACLDDMKEVRKRRMALNLIKGVTTAFEGGDIDGAMSIARGIIDDVSNGKDGEPVDTRSEQWGLDSLTQYISDKAVIEERGMLGIPGPYQILNAASSGFVPGEFTIFAAAMKMGKTYFLLQLLDYFERSGDPDDVFLFVSPETSRATIERRYMGLRLGINPKHLLEHELTPDDYRNFESWLKARGDDLEMAQRKTIFLYPDSTDSLADVIQYARVYKPKIVLIDSFYELDIGLIDPATSRPYRFQNNRDRLLKMASLINSKLAKVCHTHVIGSYQLKDGIDRWKTQITPQDLGDAKGVGRSCALLLAMLADQDMYEDKERLIQVVVSRNFPPFTFKINFDPGSNRFDFIEEIDRHRLEARANNSKKTGFKPISKG